ncbi:MAG: hypothetical protein NC117_05755 [Pseudoflavonifractor sp.]|nr:hypothetical protein [Pseudoflavonifractor sp.]
MRKSIFLILLALLAICTPQANAQWGASSRQVNLTLNNGCRFVGLESSWNSVPTYHGTLTFPDGSKFCTMRNHYGSGLDRNFQPMAGTFYKITPAGQIYSITYFQGRSMGETLMTGASYRIENDGIVVYFPNSGSSGSSGYVAPPAPAPNNNQCHTCSGTGKCTICSGTGWSPNHASGIQAKCGGCGGTGHCASCRGLGHH